MAQVPAEKVCGSLQKRVQSNCLLYCESKLTSRGLAQRTRPWQAESCIRHAVTTCGDDVHCNSIPISTSRKARHGISGNTDGHSEQKFRAKFLQWVQSRWHNPQKVVYMDPHLNDM